VTKVKSEPDTSSSRKPKAAEKSKEKSKVSSSKKRVKDEPEEPARPKKVKKEEEEEDLNAWWLNQDKNEDEDDTVKWTTLQHNGVYFPPEYVPHGVKMKYEGKNGTRCTAKKNYEVSA